jgi:hypothetical protein
VVPIARVQLPPGCTGLDMADGSRVNADRNGLVQVDDGQRSTIRRSWYGSSGVIDATEPHNIGTKKTRWCFTCQPARAWNAWNKTCPRCGAATHLEEQ